MNNFLLYQAYGKKEVKLECKFSLLILKSNNFHFNICPVIYTDEALFFEDVLKDFPYKKIVEINSIQIGEWRGEINFVHRVKIEILKDFLNTHEGNLLYCDTDTYFLQSPDKIFDNLEKGDIFMHTLEGTIDKNLHPEFKKWQKFLTENSAIIGLLNPKEIHELEMWNAGVIGFNSKHKNLLNDVLLLTDKIYRLFPKHIVEQFSFSYILQKQTQIQPTSAIIFHYWYLKEFAHYLERIFENNKQEEGLTQLQKIETYPEELLKEKITFESRPRIFRLLGRKWKL